MDIEPGSPRLPFHPTVRRYFLLMAGLLAQAVLVGIIIPATRIYAIGIGTGFLQAGLAYWLLLKLLRRFLPQIVALLYLPLALFLGTVELVLFFWPGRHLPFMGMFVGLVPITLLYPIQLPLILWQKQRQSSEMAQNNMKERLRQRM